MIKITNQDCMEIMKNTPDKYYELCIADPPYGNNLKGGGSHSGKNGWSGLQKKSDEWNIAPDKLFFDELIRISKNQIIWGANHFISKIPYDSSCWLIWDKGQRDFSLSDGEMAWTSFIKQSMRIFSYARAKCLSEEKIHCCQKPADLYRWILQNYAKPKDKIFDPMIGSGSIAIACHDMGFDLTACELDKDYYDSAINRLRLHQQQQKLNLTI